MLKLKNLINEFDSNTGKTDEKIISDFFGKDYETFVKQLGTNWQDPKIRNLILGGLKDGSRNDDKINVVTKNISVTSLTPTQKEVDLTKSLYFPHTNKFNTLNLILTSDSPIVINKTNIITLNGKYIIDGHHRWSQVYAIKPDSIMTCTDLQSSWLKPIFTLKAVQVGIATLHNGKVPTATVEGTNLFGINEITLKNYIEKTLTTEAFNIFNNFFIKNKLDVYVVKNNNKIGVKNWIWKNIQQLNSKNTPISNAPSRDVMPQTDRIENRVGALDYLKTGVINIAYPINPLSNTKKVAETINIENLFRKTFLKLDD